MELSQLRAFVAVSRHGTIAAAAESLHITPSPLSRTIRDLERAVGAELFARGYHHFELTEAGARLLPRAVEVLSEADDANAVARATPPPRIGVSLEVDDALASLFRDSASSAAATPLLARRDVTSELLCDLRHGSMDLVLVVLPPRYPDLRSVVVETVVPAPVGLAWRPRDVVHGDLVRHVVHDLAPTSVRAQPTA